VTLKVFESFSGYGSQSIALENIGIDYEVVATSEIDKYAIIAYDALHRHNMNTEVEQKTKEEMVEYLQNKRIAWDSKKEKCMLPKSEKQIRQLYEACVRSKNLGDISNIKVEDIPKHDLFTVSSPCTDFSVAGKTKGAMWTCKKCETKFNPFETNFTSKCPNCGSEEITKTASSLLVECSKIIQYCRPKFIFMENVKNLVGKKFKPFFDKWCEYLESLGYTNYYSVLNGKDFGIPQNRERVFMISIHGEHTPYEFPKGFPLKLRLKIC
jgi:DNA (cytosine-5)-methyltransferase 1